MAQKSIKINALMNTIRIISTMIFPLITFPYTSRILGPAGTGKVSFATSFVSYFILLASIGIPLYGIREIARIRDDKKKLSELTQELFVMQFITSIVMSLILIAVIFFNAKINAEKTLFFIVSFSIILTSLGMEWLYQGLEEYSYITIRSIIFSSISTVAIFIFIHNKEDYIISAAITVFASLGSSVLNFYNARKILFVKRTVPWNFKKHIKPMAMVYLMNFIISIYIQLDTVMLGFMSSAKNVGYYASGLKVTKMLLGLVTSLGGVLLPRLSYYIANDMKDEFNRMLKRSFEVIWIFCLPIVAALMLLSEEIIVLFAGNQYLPASLCIIITAPIILFIGLTNIFGIQILYPLGRDKQVVYSVTTGAIIAFTLNLLLIPYFAHIGAAIATLTSELSVLAAQLFLIPKEYRVLMPFKTISKYIIATLILILIILLIKFMISQFWLRLIIAVPSGILLYFGTLFLEKESLVMEAVTKIKGRFIHV